MGTIICLIISGVTNEIVIEKFYDGVVVITKLSASAILDFGFLIAVHAILDFFGGKIKHLFNDMTIIFTIVPELIRAIRS